LRFPRERTEVIAPSARPFLRSLLPIGTAAEARRGQ